MMLQVGGRLGSLLQGPQIKLPLIFGNSLLGFGVKESRSLWGEAFTCKSHKDGASQRNDATELGVASVVVAPPVGGGV